jgi:hypothetical protein
LQSRFLERGLPFLSPVYSSFSSQKSSPLSKFEKAFETIRKNDIYYKETLKRYNLESSEER